jgi:hypothetical protein
MRSRAIKGLVVVGIIGFIVILCSVLWLISMVYLVHFSSQEIVVLHSRNEAYIFLGKRKAAISGTRKDLLFTEMARYPHESQELDRELIVVHLGKESKSTQVIAGMSIGGGPVVVEGILYWARGGEKFRMWRWTGSSFDELNQDEAERVRGKYKYDSEQLKREGWEVTRQGFVPGTSKDIRFTLDSRPYRVTLTTTDLGKGDQRIVVTLNGGVQDATLLDLTTTFRPANDLEREEIRKGKSKP